MRIHTISFFEFRNLQNSLCELNPGLNVLTGDNAQGKTNFLEGVYLCATGRSLRGSPDKEMIRMNAKEAHIQAIADDTRIDVNLRRFGKKQVAVNQLPIRKLGDLFGNLLTVSFSPEDLKLVKSGPRERRRFVDIELCQLSGLYYQELQRYYHVLKQRNNLLRAIKNKSEGYDTLFAWDRHLVDHGFRICIQRGKFVKLLNETASEIHAGITQGKEKLRIEYAPNTQPGDLEEFIIKNRQRDIYRGATSVGIHRDDLRFFLNDADCKTFGSQGQQRTAALSSKLAVLRLIKRLKGFDPVLLLDDVLSELDKGRQQFLMAGTENIQVILTCTEMDGIKNIVPADSRIMTVTAGHVG